MVKKRFNWPTPIYVLMSMAIFLSACIGSSQQTSPTEQRNYPTVFITPLVTQIIATRSAPTATQEEAPTPTQIIADSWDPYKVGVYYPIRGCVASRLRIGDAAFVAYNGGLMGLYPSKDINYAPLLRQVQPGEAFVIVDGPWCEQNTIVWKVNTTDDEDSKEGSRGVEWEIENYVPEGNGEQYWLLPLETNPGIPTPKATQQKGMVYAKLPPPMGCGRR